jgi:hypothetical protein
MVPFADFMCVFPDMYITTIDVSIKYVIHIMVCYEKICPNCDCKRTVFAEIIITYCRENITKEGILFLKLSVKQSTNV